MNSSMDGSEPLLYTTATTAQGDVFGGLQENLEVDELLELSKSDEGYVKSINLLPIPL